MAKIIESKHLKDELDPQITEELVDIYNSMRPAAIDKIAKSSGPYRNTDSVCVRMNDGRKLTCSIHVNRDESGNEYEQFEYYEYLYSQMKKLN